LIFHLILCAKRVLTHRTTLQEGSPNTYSDLSAKNGSRLFEEKGMSVATISPRQLHDITQGGRSVELIDVRTPVEFREVHVSFARNVPLDQLNTASVTAGRRGTAEPLYVICQAGTRGERACEKFQAVGYANVVNIEGGTQAWVQAGLPVVRGRNTISLERQVRIAAGLLVLVGALLSYFIHPFWAVLPAFVGAGLAFAGLTDTCGMGMLLAKMPWNQVGPCTATSGNCLKE
jgi:rhodanese-related sulfurtransferase